VCPDLYAEVGFGYECRNTKYGEKPLECSKIKVIKIQDLTYIFWHWSNFGKTVFLTREEAERALKGEQG
jgi:predicted nucleic-acid-binding Zn-ribbon protein